MKVLISESIFKSIIKEEDFDPLAHILPPQQDLEQAEDISDENPAECLLKFSTPNQKHDSPSLNLLAGYSCPFAKTCLSKATREKDEEGNITKRQLDYGKHTQLMCFAARDENRYDHVYNKHFRNFELLRKLGKNTQAIFNLLNKSFKFWGMTQFPEFRIHNSGDFYNQSYFDAWMKMAESYPSIKFRAYTKSIPFVMKYLSEKKRLPNNMCLTLSYGSAKDELIPYISKVYGIPSAKVVKNLKDAKQDKLPVDIDDSFAKMCANDFALLAHGIMKKGSVYAPHAKANDITLKLLKYAKKIPNLAKELTPILKQAQSGELQGKELVNALKPLVLKYIPKKKKKG